jgi:hypothetical protein
MLKYLKQADDEVSISSISEDPMFRAQVQAEKTIERMERTNQILRQRNIALEVELDEIKSKFEQKDKSIALIEDALEEKQKELYRFKNLDKIEMQNLDRISNLEGEIKFKETEIDELTEQIAFDRKRNQQ